jgi:FAD:protein FMN transferase
MHCDMMAAVDRAGARVAQRLAQVPNWFALWEQRLSRFSPDSELSRINLSAGQSVRISSVMQEVLHSALRASRISDGMVTPTILGALEAAGYDRSFEELSKGEVEESESASDWAMNASGKPVMQWNSHARTVRLESGTRLDLGGIAKGWAADRAAHHLRRWGPALVNAGGDIAITAPMEDGEPWPIGVIDPFNPEKDTEILLVYQGGIATSGRDYRRWMKDNFWQHHIIDPRSGQPAQTDVLTATVVAPSAQAAEIAAKVVLIAGSSQGIEWLNQRPEYAGLVILEDGEKIQSHRWMDYVWR